MDIVKYIKSHKENLHNGLDGTSLERRKDLKIATLGFYFLLPDFEKVISKYVKIDIERKQLIADIKKEATKIYQNASEKSNAEIDVYSADYEEPEQTEIFILAAFDHAVSDIKNTESLTSLFIGIIDTLDYYENFSDKPAYWNDLLEKEVEFQNKILNILNRGEAFDTSVYQKRYENVEFIDL